MEMTLVRALRLSDSPCLALVGAGGKTTALFQLARELSGAEGRPVIVTATSHLHIDQIGLADSHWIGEKPDDFIGLEENLRGVILVTGPIAGTRTAGLNDNSIYWLHEVCIQHSLPLLIEADGSRQRLLKAPAEHEPPIPDFVECVIVVAGLSGLGKPLTEEFVHRPEIFARLSGLEPGQTITAHALVQVLTHPAGGLKNIPASAHRLALLTQADTAERQAQGKLIAEDLLGTFDAILISAADHSETKVRPSNLPTCQRLTIFAVHEPTAGIVLAAGASSRFGQPKQLLEYHGQPLVRAVTQSALSASLSPVVVVTGANAEQVEAAISDLPVAIARNRQWQAGQSSSIQAGLQALPVQAGSVLFLLADQPQVTPVLLRTLVERHARGLPAIVAPQVNGQRANPALFDRVTFPDLMSITGDVGGRAIFSKYPVTYLPWQDENLLADIDTPEDYRRLTNEQ